MSTVSTSVKPPSFGNLAEMNTSIVNTKRLMKPLIESVAWVTLLVANLSERQSNRRAITVEVRVERLGLRLG